MKPIILATSFLLAGNLSAAWVLIEDFNSLNPGLIDGQAGWSALTDNPSRNPQVVEDPLNEQNQIFDSGIDYGPLSRFSKSLGSSEIERGTTATFFFQIRLLSGINYAIGLSDTGSLGSIVADQALRLSFSNTTTDVANQELRLRHGGTSLPINNFTFTADTWYNFWVVVNITGESTGSYAVYAQAVGESQFDVPDGSQVLLQSGLTTSFAMAAGGYDLEYMTGTGQRASGIGQIFYMDNLYVDLSGLNLTNPVPEPASAALLFSAGILCFLRHLKCRRTRRQSGMGV